MRKSSYLPKVARICRMVGRRCGGYNIKDKTKRIKELEIQRRQYLNDYKLGLRKALEVVTYIREIDVELKNLKEEEKE